MIDLMQGTLVIVVLRLVDILSNLPSMAETAVHYYDDSILMIVLSTHFQLKAPLLWVPLVLGYG
jgi:hypothetical protein